MSLGHVMNKNLYRIIFNKRRGQL
ncbi:hypothetical protein GCN74_28540, partial [Janthinobacterium sp. FT14W]